MENSFNCDFFFEEASYSARVLFMDVDPWPQFMIFQTDLTLIERYGETQLFTYEHGVLTWVALELPYFDGYFRTTLAESLKNCILNRFSIRKKIKS